MILELKQCNDSKKFESTCTDHPRIKHLQPHSVSIFPRILSFHPSTHYSVCHIHIDSVFHSHWLPYFHVLLTHTHSFHQSTSSCQKRPYCTLAYWLVNLSAYLLGHLSATAVYIPHCSLEFNCRVLNCYHSPSDCIGHVTSLCVQTLLYLLWLLLFSLFICLYCYLSALCWCWMSVAHWRLVPPTPLSSSC